MELLLVRHGPAGERSAWKPTGKPDSERPLTKDGKRKTREAAKGLAKLVDGAGVVATSPYARAAQSAELLAAALGAKTVAVEALTPGAPLSAVLAWIKTRRDARVAVVGHEPQLSRLASWLMTGRDEPVLVLRKGQALLLELSAPRPGAARLLWSVPPKPLRKI